MKTERHVSHATLTSLLKAMGDALSRHGEEPVHAHNADSPHLKELSEQAKRFVRELAVYIKEK